MSKVTSLVKASFDRYGKHWPTQVFATLFAVVFGGGLLFLSWFLAPTSTAAGTNFLLVILGSVAGWLGGILFSPFNEAQTTRFRFVGQTIAAFGSGYLVSAVSPLINSLVKNASENPSAIPWTQIALLASSFLLTASVVFVSRIHVQD